MSIEIDENELQRIASVRRFDSRTLEIAHRLFIAKDKPLKLAKEYGLIHQRIYQIRRAILDEALTEGEAEVTLRGTVAAVEAAKRAFEKHMNPKASKFALRAAAKTARSPRQPSR